MRCLVDGNEELGPVGIGSCIGLNAQSMPARCLTSAPNAPWTTRRALCGSRRMLRPRTSLHRSIHHQFLFKGIMDQLAAVHLQDRYIPFPAVKSPPWHIKLHTPSVRTAFSQVNPWHAPFDDTMERRALERQRLARLPNPLLASA